MLGIAKLAVGLLFGAAAMAWMRAFPASILGVFLLIAGVGLAGASRFWDTRRGLLTGLIMAAAHLATGVLLLGFAAGWIAHAFLGREGSGPAIAAPSGIDKRGNGR